MMTPARVQLETLPGPMAAADSRRTPVDACNKMPLGEPQCTVAQLERLRWRVRAISAVGLALLLLYIVSA